MLNEIDSIIIELKKQGLNQSQIAEKLGVSRQMISYRIKKLMYKGVDIPNIKKRNTSSPQSTSKNTQLDDIDKKIIELRKQGLYNVEIAKYLNISQSTVTVRIKKMKEQGIELFDRKKKQSDDIDKKIIELRKQGLTIIEIAKQLNLSFRTVTIRIQKLKWQGIDIEDAQEKMEKQLKQSHELDSQIIELRKQGLTYDQISERLNINNVIIGSRLYRMKMKRNRNSRN